MSDTNGHQAQPLRRDFSGRDDLVGYVRSLFPEAAGRDDHVSPIRGGRSEALRRLEAVDPPRYAKTRNHIDGAVTRLSPFFRHGVLSLAEARDHALGKVRFPREAEKFVNELGWRDYFQRVYHEIGPGVWKSREDYKTGVGDDVRHRELPADIPAGETGLACIDAFARELHETGYLHNHARMYVASYVTHHRRVRWQEGAQWFLEHLLDGDPASNNLSWQWVASTFSHKPYIFNRENLERNTSGRYCSNCPVRGHCDFEGSYDDLEERLFPRMRGPEPAPARGRSGGQRR